MTVNEALENDGSGLILFVSVLEGDVLISGITFRGIQNFQQYGKGRS